MYRVEKASINFMKDSDESDGWIFDIQGDEEFIQVFVPHEILEDVFLSYLYEDDRGLLKWG